jgi:hypothetical protein
VIRYMSGWKICESCGRVFPPTRHRECQDDGGNLREMSEEDRRDSIAKLLGMDLVRVIDANSRSEDGADAILDAVAADKSKWRDEIIAEVLETMPGEQPG